jgi:hypothetical protein
MFPISSGQTRFIDIANYWSGEIKPRVPPRTLRDTLIKAWWRGELVAANEPSRVHLLRGLHSKCADHIAFVIPGAPEPPCSRALDDGGVEVFRLVRVPLLDAQSDTWTDANCTEAFSAIAEAWDEELFSLLAHDVLFIPLTRSEFIQWAEKCGNRPTFRGRASEDEDWQRPTNEAVARKAIEGGRYALPEGPRKGRAAADARRVLLERWGQEGPPCSWSIRKITDDAYKYRRKLPETKDYPVTADSGFSEITVRRVLGLSK